MALKPIMSDSEIRRRKKLQGTISRTTSTLGLAALSAKGAGSALPKMAKLGSKGVAWGARADKAATNALVLSAGVGGLGGYNFASYTNAESRKRQQTGSPTKVKKDMTMPDLERSTEIFKAKKASKGRLAAGAAFPVLHGAVAGKKGHKLRAVGREAGGTVGGALLGNAVGLASRRPVLGMQAATVGSFAGGALGTASAQRHGHLKKQKIKKNTEIFKAFDPEQQRKRRLDHYATATSVGAGAAGAGAVHQFHAAKKGGVLKLPKNPVFGRGVRSAGKAGALGAAAVGAAVASDRIRSYKHGRAGKMTPLRPTGY